MNIIKLKHLSASKVADSQLFNDIKNYNNFINKVIKYGNNNKKLKIKDSDESKTAYNDAVGEVFEVYTEFFMIRYGTEANPHLGVKLITDTSQNKYQAGYDFTYQTFFNEPARLQSKFRSNPNDKLTLKDLGTFVSMCDGEGILKDRRILFTNLEHSENNQVFHFSYKYGNNQMRVFDKNAQLSFIKRDPTFWEDFSQSLILSIVPRSDFKKPHAPRDYQKKMINAGKKILKSRMENRTTIIAATGAGKSLSQYFLIKHGFENCNFTLQIIVAPTIALSQQHYLMYENYGMFHKDGIKPIEFMTGQEARTDSQIEYFKTTSIKELSDNVGNKTLIFVTYASFEKLVIGLKLKNINPDAIHFDEFQNLIIQKKQQKELIESLIGKIIFWSASIKRGRIISALDEKLFGKIYVNISYKELRVKGIVVPVKVIPVYVNYNTEALKPIKRSLKEAAKDKNIDFNKFLSEVAGTIISYTYMKEKFNNCNLITFSKQVDICKEIVKNSEIMPYFNGDLNTIHAATQMNERNYILDTIKKSTDSVLVQHSVISEGIDVTSFNASFVARGMEIIPTQQGPIGRISRAHPEDTKNLELGKISIDSPEGWIKPCGYMFVLVDSSDSNDNKNFLKDIVKKLQESGLSEDDYQFMDIQEERNGVFKSEDWIAPVENISEILDSETLEDVINKARIEIENEVYNEELQRKIDELDNTHLIKLFKF